MNTCQWFLLCDNPATKTRPHSVLGDVSICDRCDDKTDRIGRAIPQHERADAWSRD